MYVQEAMIVASPSCAIGACKANQDVLLSTKSLRMHGITDSDHVLLPKAQEHTHLHALCVVCSIASTLQAFNLSKITLEVEIMYRMLQLSKQVLEAT